MKPLMHKTYRDFCKLKIRIINRKANVCKAGNEKYKLLPYGVTSLWLEKSTRALVVFLDFQFSFQIIQLQIKYVLTSRKCICFDV